MTNSADGNDMATENVVNIVCEYIWLDGGSETKNLRSKSKVFQVKETAVKAMYDNLRSGNSPHGVLPLWGFDGSSTGQADGSNSDCVLKPVFLTTDPVGGVNCFLVLCEVFNTDFTPHDSNSRAKLRDVIVDAEQAHSPRVGFEQEYVLMNKDNCRPLGWPDDSSLEPAQQGPYYCGVGSSKVAGRSFVATHLSACINSGLSVTGINAEVMLGQWEYQVGGPGVDALTTCDHLWISRFLLHRLSENTNHYVTLDPKPVEGDWNGSGLHTNFSTRSMREQGGYENITSACETLSSNIEEHLSVYGDGYERRLTGEHETAHYSEFSYGVSDRGASVRIPWQVEKEGCGYLEDRRPNSNADPYEVVLAMTKTLCG